MSNPKTVDEIELSYSKSQVYWRINKLVESGLMDPPKRGERNQYLLDSEDVTLLKTLGEIEDQYDSVKEAIAGLEEKSREKVTGEVLRDRISELEERIDVLENRVDFLESRVSVEGDRLQKFKDKWSDQLKEGAKKVKDLFG